ncbi:MAG: protein translocase subunit SecDF [Bacteroidetes bacterium HGW-Bacteroidetes-4]|jgi:SecD/SecF fusion protein|nr:MAG: protein translocase subunit SecDF [Bacteroidetes bacterium HGW-Bacteroidetes-4]
MQNKGAIRLVAIMFALVSAYQLFFTVKTAQVEKDAREYAQGNKLKEVMYLDSIATKPVYNFFWIKEFTYRDCKEREINLGLDLKGGMNVILEVSVVDVVRSLSNYSNDATFNKAIEVARKRQVSDGQANFVSLFGQAFQELDPNAQLAAIFNTIELKDKVNFSSTNQEVLNVIRQEAESAISNSFNILRNRIDKFGVTQPNIQRLGNSGRILVELPGVKDPERVRKLLQGTANLEFWETYDNTELVQQLYAANDKIKEINEAKKALETKKDSVVESPQNKTAPQLAPQNEADQALSLIEQLESDSTAVDTTMGANLANDFPLFSVLQPRFSRDNQPLPGAAIGIAHFKDTNKVNDYLALPQVKALFPRNLKLLWGVKAIDTEEQFYELYAIKVTSRDGRAALEGDVITNARKEYAQGRGDAEVSMSMNAEGAKVWARLTGNNVGRAIAIVLDNYVYSAPNVNQEIKGGRSSITGGFTVTEAEDLANILKSGKMPAPAKIEQETIVGPSLGQEAIQKGLWSFVIAFVIVLLFMIFYYSSAGFAANLALITNVFFIMGVLASLGAVLTLPGIAGIVLTIGMAVDANVLIFERIREELAAGKGIKLAIKDGYGNAYSAIIDSNLTTLITAFILGYFGKGPIHGFAITLGIGILSSLFSAIFITRFVFERTLAKNKEPKFATKISEGFLKNTKIDFLGKRKIFYAISSVLVLISIGSLATRGLNQSIDFTGGRTYVIRFNEPVNTVDVQSALMAELGTTPEVKTYGEANQVKITTKYLVDAEMAPEADMAMATEHLTGDNPDVDDVVEVKLFTALKKGKFLSEELSFKEFISEYRMSSEKVGPTIAGDIKRSAVYSVVFALIAIFLYILFRFRNWQYGMGAVVALIHDVIIILGLYSLTYSIMPFSMSVDQAFIAAILTVVGYSINDTVVVFDRIREYLLLYSKRDRKDILNVSLNSTLSRTFMTSLTTFLVLLTIFIFGGEVIRGFVFAILVGIVVGTYSSLFVATPVVYDTMRRSEKKKR